MTAAAKRTCAKWTPEEDAVLESHYRQFGHAGKPAIIEGRTVAATYKHAVENGWLTRQSSNQWKVTEVRILKENCHLGIRECLKLLPGRSWGAVCSQARKLGLKLLAKTSNGKETIDDTIKRYCTAHNGLDMDVIKKISIQLGCNPMLIKRRSVKLGLMDPFSPRRNWTAKEEEILRENAHSVKIATQELNRQGYPRSIGAVTAHRYDLFLHLENDDCYSAKELAECLGCSPKTILDWQRKGLLRQSQTTAKYGAVAWNSEDIRKFLMNNPRMWDIKKVDNYFLTNILIGA